MSTSWWKVRALFVFTIIASKASLIYSLWRQIMQAVPLTAGPGLEPTQEAESVMGYGWLQEKFD